MAQCYQVPSRQLPAARAGRLEPPSHQLRCRRLTAEAHQPTLESQSSPEPSRLACPQALAPLLALASSPRALAEYRQWLCLEIANRILYVSIISLQPFQQALLVPF